MPLLSGGDKGHRTGKNCEYVFNCPLTTIYYTPFFYFKWADKSTTRYDM